MKRTTTITESKFHELIILIKKSGINVVRDRTVAHYPLYTIKCGSINKIMIGYCYLPKTLTTENILNKNKKRGVAINIWVNKDNRQKALKMSKMLNKYFPNAHWYFDDREKRRLNPIKYIEGI